MIENLPRAEQEWLTRFFSAPNELTWQALVDGSAPAAQADQIRRWLTFLASDRPGVPIILPFMRNEKIAGWYATAQTSLGGYQLGEEINAWLGPTWLSHLDRVSNDTTDPMASALRDRFGGTIYRFTGSDDEAIRAITVRLGDFAAVLERRPSMMQSRVRPVGAIRCDFERALLARDEAQAEAMIAELKDTGRLNEENLRYLEVRLSAGLGLWPQIARDHWLIKNMADLALPPQILADIIEALYRTYVEEAEATGDAAATLEAFARNIVTPYPKLFTSRRGIRAPRVVKAFLLFEQLQESPNAAISAGLLDLLPPDTTNSLFAFPSSEKEALAPATTITSDEADEAFDDGQIDRALEFYLQLPPSKKTIIRLVSCVGTIGTEDSRDRVLELLDRTDPVLISGLSQAIAEKIESFRRGKDSARSTPRGTDLAAASVSDTNPWMRWAEQLREGRDLPAAERAAQTATTNWDASEIRQSTQLAQRFADIIGNLGDEASVVARAALPHIFASFFPPESQPCAAAKPIASLLFMLIAMDDALSRPDLDLLAQLTTCLIEQGLSTSDYRALIADLEDVQKRIGSYAYLPWSLDLCEALATSPCPSEEARDGRLRLFLLAIGQVTGFAHRLGPQDLLPIETLAKDFGVDSDVLTALKRDVDARESTTVLPSLAGKTVGIYTLSEAAGSRAKGAIEKVFPGCKVVVNSDLVCTSQLTSLAKAADIFIFAWKSSSHQAFYCIKDALSKGAPIWAPGKGTASILRAVLDNVR